MSKFFYRPSAQFFLGTEIGILSVREINIMSLEAYIPRVTCQKYCSISQSDDWKKGNRRNTDKRPSIFLIVALYRNIDNVDKTMNEINEQTENLKQIQEALSAPIGAAADFDEV